MHPERPYSTIPSPSEFTSPLTTVFNLLVHNPFWTTQEDPQDRLTYLISYVGTFAEAADMSYPDRSTEVWTVAALAAHNILRDDPIFTQYPDQKTDYLMAMADGLLGMASTAHGDFESKRMGIIHGASGMGFNPKQENKATETPLEQADRYWLSDGIKMVKNLFNSQDRSIHDGSCFYSFCTSPYETNPRFDQMYASIELPEQPKNPLEAAGLFMFHCLCLLNNKLPKPHFKEAMSAGASLLEKAFDLENANRDGSATSQYESELQHMQRVCLEGLCRLSRHFLEAGHKELLFDLQEQFALSKASHWAEVAASFTSLPATVSPADMILSTLKSGAVDGGPLSIEALSTALSDSRERIKAMEESAELTALLSTIPSNLNPAIKAVRPRL